MTKWATRSCGRKGVWKTDHWENLGREESTYDEAGNWIELDEFVPDGADWVYDYRIRFTHDESGNIIEQIVEDWEGNEWVNDNIATNVYDESGNLLSRTVQSWNDTAFENSFRNLYTYMPAVGTAITDDRLSETPGRISLYQNYPNPFNPSTTIRYEINERRFVSLAVYDAAGRLVESLVNSPQSAGSHSVTWDAKGIPSGAYFCRLEAGGVVDIRTMFLLR